MIDNKIMYEIIEKQHESFSASISICDVSGRVIVSTDSSCMGEMNLLAIEDLVWERLLVWIVWHWMQQHKDKEIPAVFQTVAESFYGKYIQTADFAGCQIWEDHTHYQRKDWKCYYLIYFAQRLKFPMGKEKALGLLLFGVHIYKAEMEKL